MAAIYSPGGHSTSAEPFCTVWRSVGPRASSLGSVSLFPHLGREISSKIAGQRDLKHGLPNGLFPVESNGRGPLYSRPFHPRRFEGACVSEALSLWWASAYAQSCCCHCVGSAAVDFCSLLAARPAVASPEADVDLSGLLASDSSEASQNHILLAGGLGRGTAGRAAAFRRSADCSIAADARLRPEAFGGTASRTCQPGKGISAGRRRFQTARQPARGRRSESQSTKTPAEPGARRPPTTELAKNGIWPSNASSWRSANAKPCKRRSPRSKPKWPAIAGARQSAQTGRPARRSARSAV